MVNMRMISIDSWVSLLLLMDSATMTLGLHFAVNYSPNIAGKPANPLKLPENRPKLLENLILNLPQRISKRCVCVRLQSESSEPTRLVSQTTPDKHPLTLPPCR